MKYPILSPCSFPCDDPTLATLTIMSRHNIITSFSLSPIVLLQRDALFKSSFRCDDDDDVVDDVDPWWRRCRRCSGTPYFLASLNLSLSLYPAFMTAAHRVASRTAAVVLQHHRLLLMLPLSLSLHSLSRPLPLNSVGPLGPPSCNAAEAADSSSSASSSSHSLASSYYSLQRPAPPLLNWCKTVQLMFSCGNIWW